MNEPPDSDDLRARIESLRVGAGRSKLAVIVDPAPGVGPVVDSEFSLFVSGHRLTTASTRPDEETVRSALRVVTDSRWAAVGVHANYGVVPVIARPPVDPMDASPDDGRGIAVLTGGEMSAEVVAMLARSGHRAVAVEDASSIEGVAVVVDPRLDHGDIEPVARGLSGELGVVIPYGSGACVDLIRHDSSGSVVDPHPGGLAEAAIALLQDPHRRARLGFEGKMLEAEASWGQVGRALFATHAASSSGGSDGRPRLDDLGRVARTTRWSGRLGHASAGVSLTVAVAPDVASETTWAQVREALLDSNRVVVVDVEPTELPADLFSEPRCTALGSVGPMRRLGLDRSAESVLDLR